MQEKQPNSFIDDILTLDYNTGPIISGTVPGVFDKAINILEKNGFHLPTMSEAARLRIQEAPNIEKSKIRYQDYLDYSIGPIYDKPILTSLHYVFTSESVYLSKVPYILENLEKVKESVYENVNKKEISFRDENNGYMITDKELDLMLSDSIELTRNDRSISLPEEFDMRYDIDKNNKHKKNIGKTVLTRGYYDDFQKIKAHRFDQNKIIEFCFNNNSTSVAYGSFIFPYLNGTELLLSYKNPIKETNHTPIITLANLGYLRKNDDSSVIRPDFLFFSDQRKSFRGIKYSLGSQ